MDTLTFHRTDPSSATLTANLSRVYLPSGGTEFLVWKVGGFPGIRKVIGNEPLQTAKFLLWLADDNNTLVVREFFKWTQSEGGLGTIEFSQVSVNQDGTQGEPLTEADINWDGIAVNMGRVEELTGERGPWQRKFLVEFTVVETEDSD